MSEQPEALRLADELCAPVPDYPAPTSLEEAAAAELRRLYQLAQEQHTVIYGLRLEVCNLLKAKVEAMFNPPAQPATEESSATQPAPVQPVAWVNHGENRITRATGWDGYGALYDAPPAQPASCPHGMVDTCCENYGNCNQSAPQPAVRMTDEQIGNDPIFRAGVRFAEAAHGITEKDD